MQASRGGFSELWSDFLQQSQGLWAQAATVPKPPDHSQQWKQFFGLWTEFWGKALSQSPDTFQNAQKLWLEQLETVSQSLANVMGTEAYGAAMSKFFQEQLAWQDKTAKATHPQIDGALRAMNLPSRGQIDRLFERIVGIEERLDDLETDARQIRRALRHVPAPAAAE
jgi:hypothetical protein